MPHLVRLRNICKDDVHHGHQHTVLGWMAGVFNYGDDVGPLLGHVDQITPCTQGSTCFRKGPAQHVCCCMVGGRRIKARSVGWCCLAMMTRSTPRLWATEACMPLEDKAEQVSQGTVVPVFKRQLRHGPPWVDCCQSCSYSSMCDYSGGLHAPPRTQHAAQWQERWCSHHCSGCAVGSAHCHTSSRAAPAWLFCGTSVPAQQLNDKKAALAARSPLLCENSTAYTAPSLPTMSETWDTLVPDAAPRYNTFAPGLMWMLSTPASTEAASFDLQRGEWWG